jgi:hypothetical protein
VRIGAVVRIEEKVCWLNISMGYAPGVNIPKCAKETAKVSSDRNKRQTVVVCLQMVGA